MARSPRLMATLFPSNPHFAHFACDPRFTGIRLNHPLASMDEVEQSLSQLAICNPTVPLWYDVKGRQIRVVSTTQHGDCFEIELNHRVSVATPTFVYFKSGRDRGILTDLRDDGKILVVRPEYDSATGLLVGPKFRVFPGESLHILDETLIVYEPVFTQLEIAKIERLKKAGFKRWFLSYVESQRDIDRLTELVGKDAEIMAKIESRAGLEFVRSGRFKKRDGHTLVAARGDLYVELGHPRYLPAALKAIIDEDPEAVAGSRILLSIMAGEQVSAADFSELAWLYDIGYRTMLLCDDICLNKKLLERATSEFCNFYTTY